MESRGKERLESERGTLCSCPKFSLLPMEVVPLYVYVSGVALGVLISFTSCKERLKKNCSRV
jgi:hypothetical protein